MEVAHPEILLLIQLGGIHIAYMESKELFSYSIPKLIGTLFVLFLPTILYINLLFLNEFR